MKAHLTRRYLFSASHRLHSAEMSAEENLATYGKCNNPHGHGHNYTLEVTVSGPVDPATGMVCNLVDLDGFVEREVLSRYDLAEFEYPARIRPGTCPPRKISVSRSSKYCSAAFKRRIWKE